MKKLSIYLLFMFGIMLSTCFATNFSMVQEKLPANIVNTVNGQTGDVYVIPSSGSLIFPIGMLQGTSSTTLSGLTGTANSITKWTDANTIGNSLITDDGTSVAIGLNNAIIANSGGFVSITTTTARTELTINGVVSEKQVLLTSTTTISTPVKYIDCNTTTSTFTVTLATALLAYSTTTFSCEYIIQDVSGTAMSHTIIIATEGTEKINGLDSAVINSNYGFIRLRNNGVNWFVTGS
jgi:hypothetical protein